MTELLKRAGLFRGVRAALASYVVFYVALLDSVVSLSRSGMVSPSIHSQKFNRLALRTSRANAKQNCTQATTSTI